MKQLKEKFETSKRGKEAASAELTLYDFNLFLNGIIKAAVDKSPDDTRLINHVAPTLFYPFYDLTHKLAVARPGLHFTEAEMKKTPFAQVLPALQKGIDKFLADPDHIVGGDFKSQLSRFLPATPSQKMQHAPEMVAA